MHYNYVAVSKAGKKAKGMLNAIDKNDAISQLRDQGLTAMKLEENDMPRGGSQSIWSAEIGSGNIHKIKIKKKKLLTILNQLGIMMKAGVPLATAMDVLIGTERKKDMRAIWEEVNDDLYAGVPLSQSMGKFKAFPDIIINVVQAGEANGRLDVAFERCALIVEKDIALSAKIRGAMSYPIFLLFLTFLLVLVMSVIVLPSFVGVFAEYDAQMPGITLAMIAFSDFIINRWYLVIVVGVILITGFIVLKSSCPPFAMFLSRIAMKIPLIGILLKQSYIARFCRVMASLVEAGVNIVESLEISANVIENLYMKGQIANVVADVKIGSSIHQSMTKYPMFDPLLVSMIRVGEESGLLFETLGKMSDLYEQQTDESTKRLTTMMEPAMTIIIAFIVGTVIISIVIPMFGMYGVLSGG